MPRWALLALSALALGADALAVDSQMAPPGLRHGAALAATDGVSSLQPLNRMGMGGGVREPGEGRNASAQGQPDAEENSLMCLTDTGGTCFMNDCHPWRGATCIWSVCRCTTGTCAGADGKCYPRPNEVVQDSVRFRNVAWPDTWLAMNSWAVWTESSHALHALGEAPTMTPETEFTVVRLPDGSPMLVSKVDPGHALTLRVDENDQKRVAPASIASRPAPKLATKLTSVPWKDGAMMMSNHFYPNRHYLAWSFNRVEWSAGDPGEMGYWMPDRPLKVELKLFEGRRCFFDCNHVTWRLIEAFFLTCAFLFIVFSCWLFCALNLRRPS